MRRSFRDALTRTRIERNLGSKAAWLMTITMAVAIITTEVVTITMVAETITTEVATTTMVAVRIITVVDALVSLTLSPFRITVLKTLTVR